MRPVSIPSYIQAYWDADNHSEAVFETIRSRYQKLNKGEPEVSVVIPAYNEEKSIVQTLLSLTSNITSRSVEIVVANNNSKDRTAELVEKCGIKCILETKQGIVPARNAGLSVARGKYVLNADADSLYPDCWIEEMTKPLEDESVAITYNSFSFIPVGSTGRNVYFFYEYFADLMRAVNKYIKDEAVNVYGFSSGFRRLQGLEVDGFNFPAGAGEDGWLAVKLREKGFGKLYEVRKTKAYPWTTDRRIQIDGGLWKGTWKRLKRMVKFRS